MGMKTVGRNLVGSRLHRCRTKAGLTVQQFGDQLAEEGVHLSPAQVIRIEMRTRRVTDYELVGIAKIFGKTIEWFLTGRSSRKRK